MEHFQHFSTVGKQMFNVQALFGVARLVSVPPLSQMYPVTTDHYSKEKKRNFTSLYMQIAVRNTWEGMDTVL